MFHKGFGFCLIYIPSVLVVGFYFEKWRALATGISLCGSGIGTFIFAPLTENLLKLYGWRMTLVFQAGMNYLMLFIYFNLTVAFCSLPFVCLKE